MNILFVTCAHRIGKNADSGASARTNMFVRALALVGHVDIISFCEKSITECPYGCDVIFDKFVSEEYPRWTLRYKILNRLKQLFLPLSPKTYYPVSSARINVVERVLSNRNYDFVACRYLREATSCGLTRHVERLVVDVDDNPVNVLRIMQRRSSLRWPWTRAFNKWEIYATTLMTRYVLGRVLCSFYSNPDEKPADSSVFLHNVSPTAAVSSPINEGTPLRLLIVGWLDYQPNREGTMHFVRHIFPVIRQNIPGAELRIVGKCSDPVLMETLNAVDGVSAPGYVPDITKEYQMARVVVIPVYQGTGTSVKFSEALMMNRPIVSSAMGARGFEHVCRDGVHYCCALNDEEFADKTVNLLKDIDAANDMARRAFVIGEKHFSQQRFYDIVKKALLSRCLAMRI